MEKLRVAVEAREAEQQNSIWSPKESQFLHSFKPLLFFVLRCLLKADSITSGSIRHDSSVSFTDERIPWNNNSMNLGEEEVVPSHGPIKTFNEWETVHKQIIPQSNNKFARRTNKVGIICCSSQQAAF